ncbi:MAG: DEAD/DEAH box helicase family protein, partial [Phycisphaerales bacterium]|nr:DEAD/DEAH box helicase family protein [Phycisphaerales bacterium]
MTQPLDSGSAVSGLHDRLLSLELRTALASMGDDRIATLADVDSGEAHDAVAQYLELLIAGTLSRHRGEEGVRRQREIVRRILTVLSDEMEPDWAEGKSLADPLQRLLAVHARSTVAPLRPDTPLARSSLLTGARGDPSLSLQLQKEIANADRVDILCSFIKWSGLRLLLPALESLVASPTSGAPRLRVITTSYMGATDPRAVEALHQLPNTDVRVSYDTARTRLHAKAYIIHRATGFGSAYVGSANISGAALSEGLEWTSKISQFELPYLWQRINATFDAYWNDHEFERVSPDTQRKFSEAIQHERNTGANDGAAFVAFDLKPFPFQEEILDQIAAERVVRKKTNHLIVAATGTGKTMVAAFDYKRWCASSSPRPTLLFVAHREEILRQALGTFRAVLRDQNFGDVLVGGSNPSQHSHLFCSIQTYASRELWRQPADQFHYVVVDEFHHAAAPTYGRLLDHIRPQVLLGLTATPERSDTLDVFRWFDGRATAEIRLPDAIGLRLL